jgi:uncharacterized protein DUF3309
LPCLTVRVLRSNASFTKRSDSSRIACFDISRFLAFNLTTYFWKFGARAKHGNILRFSEERRCSIALPAATSSTGGTVSQGCSFVGGETGAFLFSSRAWDYVISHTRADRRFQDFPARIPFSATANGDQSMSIGTILLIILIIILLGGFRGRRFYGTGYYGGGGLGLVIVILLILILLGRI